MKRSTLLILCAVIFCGIVSFCFLAFVFSKSFCECLNSLFEAIFTGTLISIPGYIFLLYEEKKETTTELNGVLYNALVVMQDCLYNNSQQYIGATTEIKRQKIVAIYKHLGKINSKHLSSQNNRLNIIRDCMFNFSKNIVELNTEVSSNKITVGDSNFNNRVKILNECAEQCITSLRIEIDCL